MRLEKKLVEGFIQVRSLPGKCATLGKALQRVDLLVHSFYPPGCAEGRPFVNVLEGLTDPGLSLRRDDDSVPSHSREIPRSLASAWKNSRIGRPSPRLDCSSP